MREIHSPTDGMLRHPIKPCSCVCFDDNSGHDMGLYSAKLDDDFYCGCQCENKNYANKNANYVMDKERP